MADPGKGAEKERDEGVAVIDQPGGSMSVATDPNAPPPPPEQYGLPCARCQTLYPLPRGATTWRCRACGHFNAIQSDGPFVICTIC